MKLAGTERNDRDWRGAVLVWDEQAIFLGEAADASLHESPAIKLCVALEKNFGIQTGEGETFINYEAVLIAAGQPHAIDGRHHRMVMLLLAPETELAQPLVPMLQDTGVAEIPAAAAEKIRTIVEGLNIGPSSGIIVGYPPAQMIAALEGDRHSPIDPRIAQSIAAIRSSRDEGVSVAEIAHGVELSESRFSHLFTEYVRVPVRRYLLWLRLRDAMHLLAQNKSLTEIAHEAGFADSAHLTRSFRSMLGIAPSALRESTIVSFLK
jgi:AraC-like DNA-binding protein